MAHFIVQNDSFRRTKRAVLESKMNRFGSVQSVKKLQVFSFQFLTTFARFACTSPSDFYFRTMAFSEAKNDTFVYFFHILKTIFLFLILFRVSSPRHSCHCVGKKPVRTSITEHQKRLLLIFNVFTSEILAVQKTFSTFAKCFFCAPHKLMYVCLNIKIRD